MLFFVLRNLGTQSILRLFFAEVRCCGASSLVIPEPRSCAVGVFAGGGIGLWNRLVVPHRRARTGKDEGTLSVRTTYVCLGSCPIHVEGVLQEAVRV